MSASQIAWLNWSCERSASMRAIPAAFQYRALASSATATKAPPMAEARAPTAIFKNCPSNVPTFSKIWAPPAILGSIAPSRPKAAIVFFTWFRLRPAALANDDELTALRAGVRLDHEHVHAAHHVLAVARDEIPPRLPIVRRVLLPVVPRNRHRCRVQHRVLRQTRIEVRIAHHRRPPQRLVHLVARVQHLH